MNIDQRLDRLTERHEALALSVELIAVGIQKLEQRHEVLAQTVEVLATSSQRHEKALDRLEGITAQNGVLMTQLLEITANLGIKIGNPEHRISALERPN